MIINKWNELFKLVNPKTPGDAVEYNVKTIKDYIDSQNEKESQNENNEQKTQAKLVFYEAILQVCGQLHTQNSALKYDELFWLCLVPYMELSCGACFDTQKNFTFALSQILKYANTIFTTKPPKTHEIIGLVKLLISKIPQVEPKNLGDNEKFHLQDEALALILFMLMAKDEGKYQEDNLKSIGQYLCEYLQLFHHKIKTVDNTQNISRIHDTFQTKYKLENISVEINKYISDISNIDDITFTDIYNAIKDLLEAENNETYKLQKKVRKPKLTFLK